MMDKLPLTHAGSAGRRPFAEGVGLAVLVVALGLLAPRPALAHVARVAHASNRSSPVSTAVAGREFRRTPRLLIGDFTSRFVMRPAAISFGASANEVIGGPGISSSQFEAGDLGHIRWYRWTPARASGRGLLWSNDCSPNCPEGTYHSSPVAITARNGFSGRYRRLFYVGRVDGRRVHFHARLKRLPGSPTVWSWW